MLEQNQTVEMDSPAYRKELMLLYKRFRYADCTADEFIHTFHRFKGHWTTGSVNQRVLQWMQENTLPSQWNSGTRSKPDDKSTMELDD
jgi:hypothetical protein